MQLVFAAESFVGQVRSEARSDLNTIAPKITSFSKWSFLIRERSRLEFSKHLTNILRTILTLSWKPSQLFNSDVLELKFARRNFHRKFFVRPLSNVSPLKLSQCLLSLLINYFNAICCSNSQLNCPIQKAQTI